LGRIAARIAFGGIDFVLATALASMVVLIFGNVVLRYGFGSGLAFSEELARYGFIWMTFLGAVAALREGEHLGMQGVVARLPRSGRICCFWVSRTIMLACCLMLAHGAMAQAAMNIADRSPVAGVPMIMVYGVAVLASIAMSLIIALEAWRGWRHGLNDEGLAPSADPGRAPT
jgi:TRAP-type C4-dicarboxylate transport system permease small subunit